MRPRRRRLAHDRDTQPDFVLLDIDMPGAAGIETTARGRSALPRGHDRASRARAAGFRPRGRGLPREAAAAQTDRALPRPRAQARLAERRIAGLALEIAGAAAAMQGLAPLRAGPSGSRFADQMTIRVRRRMFALPVADITWIEGASQYSRVHAKAASTCCRAPCHRSSAS